jgi:hypothetical protein
MTSQEIIPSALSALSASVPTRTIVLNNVEISFYEDNISDDLLTYTDNEVLDYQPLLFPTAKKVIKINGGKIVISDDCFIPYIEGEEECCVNGGNCVFNDDYVGEKIMYQGLCPCSLQECKNCFITRVASQFHNNYNNTRCLSNNHKGNNYCKTVKQTETKTETIEPITSSQISKYRKEKQIMRDFMEYNYDVYEANVKGKDFNELPLCFKIFKNLCETVEDMVLVGSERDETIDYKRQYFFYLDNDVKQPIRWGLGGYDWDDFDSWRYAHTSFYVMYRDKAHKRFFKTRISFDEDEQILDTIESHILDQPNYYGREYCFNMLKDNFRDALDFCDSQMFIQLTENDNFEALLIEMIDTNKVNDVCKSILSNDDVNIVELMGCESVKYERMIEGDGVTDTDYTIIFYDEGLELNANN